MPVRSSPVRGLAALILALAPAAALGATTLEVEVGGTFAPLEGAIVPTPRPMVRVALDAGVSLVSVTLERDDGEHLDTGDANAIGHHCENHDSRQTEGKRIPVGFEELSQNGAISALDYHEQATAGDPQSKRS